MPVFWQISRRSKRSSAQEVEALQRINLVLGATLDLNDVLRRIITEITHLLAAQSASVILHNDATNEAELTTTYGTDGAFRTLRYPLPGSLTAWVAEYQRPLRVPRLTQQEWPAVWQLAEQLGMRPTHLSVLVVPLWIRDKVVGSLEVVWEPYHAICDHEEKLLEAIAVQAAIAITNGRLYQEKEQALQEAKKNEERLQHRLQMERLLATLSSRFMNVASHELERELTVALQAIGELVGVDRSYIFWFSADGATMENTHEWCAPGIEPQRDNLKALPTETFPWWMDKLRRGEPLPIPRVADLPPEASAEKAILQAQAIQSLLVVPLGYDKALKGFLGFDAVRGEHTWAAEDIALLTLVGEIFVGALERKRAEEVLQHEVQLSRALVRVGQALIASLDTPSILEQLCQVTTEVLTCDASHTFLWQPADDTYVPVSGYGGTAAQWEAMRVMRIPRHAIAGLLTRLAQEGIVDVVLTEPQDFVPAGLARHYGGAVGLYMALWRGQELIGFQSATYRGQTLRFTPWQKRIAHGIAQMASLALHNARLLEQAEEANRLKSAFLATISHELRTPLNVVMGYTDLLLEEDFGPLHAQQRPVLQAVQRAACEEVELITALLDVSRLEAGRSPVEVTSVNMSELIEELKQETARTYERSSLAFVWRIAQELPQIQTDRAKLKIILKNLLSNAAKFTPQGTITVEASAREGGVDWWVTDTGIGIDSAVLPVIFDPFRQGDSSTTRRYGGIGLGLYIVQRMVELLGGTVSVNSEVGKGSTFRVWVPNCGTAASCRAVAQIASD